MVNSRLVVCHQLLEQSDPVLQISSAVLQHLIEISIHPSSVSSKPLVIAGLGLLKDADRFSFVM
jgi:hypothetical protein